MHRSKNEVSDFLFDISHYLMNCPKDNDIIWEKIVSDALEVNKKSNDPSCTDKTLFPFMNSESPDIIYKSDDFIMGIECFEFDASKRTRNGSSQRKKEVQAEKTIISEYHKTRNITDESISIEHPMDIDFSLEDYKNSLISVYMEHAKKVQQYKNNLSKNSAKKVYLSFYIKDITALGCYVNLNQKIVPLQPCFIKEFRNLLETSGIDYLLTNINDNYIHKFFIQRIDESLNSIYNAFDTLSSTDFISYKYCLTNHFLPI